MDPVSNPYSPGSGIPPAELVGREDRLQTVRVAIERMRRGLPTKNVLLVGLRGMGKTVLLDRMLDDARASGIPTLRLSDVGRRSLPATLAPELRLALLRLVRHEGSRPSSIRALRALAGFAGAQRKSFRDLEVGVDYEAERGLADSGVLEQDLPDLLELAGAAAKSSQTALVLFMDELQFLPPRQLAALTVSLNHCAQRGLPLALVGAGLPQLRGQVQAVAPEAERLFEFFDLGPLPPEAATRALLQPAAELNVQLEDAAVAYILATTQCCPYFLQELAKQAWDAASQSPITLQDARDAAHFALAALDEKFFRACLDRLTRAERQYMRAMAELGPGTHRSGDIAAVLNRPVTSLGLIRSHLITKGVLWSPGHGETAYTVPRFDEFLRRAWPGSAWRV